MKKHLIAAAVAAAVSVPAMAQVTVSGNVEAGFASAKRGANWTQTGVTSGVVGTPVIRFSGSEDLGGGIKAMFQLDFEHNTASGLVDNASADLGVSTVGLSGGFGSVVLGKGATRARDAGGVYRFFGNQGRLANAASNGSAKFNSDDEVASLVEYITPTIQGFSVSVAYHGAGTTASTGTRAAEGSAYSLRGVVGPVTFQYGQERQAAERTSATANSHKSTNWNTLGANANLGVARLGLVYAETFNDGASARAKATGLHAAVPMGAFTVGGSYTDYRGATTGSNTKVTVANAVYALSKRTAVHGTYQMVAGGTTAAGISSSRALNVGEENGKTNTGYAISVVHSF